MTTIEPLNPQALDALYELQSEIALLHAEFYEDVPDGPPLKLILVDCKRIECLHQLVQTILHEINPKWYEQ